ncbi:MAG: type 4a pilus biogenesis protein PilO [Patescibacteria group bacterium]
MDLNIISKSIFTKKSGNYVFIIFFFLIFSVFIIFAIEPSLKTAFSLKKEEKDLKKIDQVYEEKIGSITSIQTQIEESRNDLPLLNQSISENPEVNKIIEDIKKTADKNSLTISKANIVDINLSKVNQELQEIRLIMEVTTNFDNLRQFMIDLSSQRRLKVIDNITINRDRESSASGELDVALTIDGYYL